jgi:hypothetical protein
LFFEDLVDLLRRKSRFDQGFYEARAAVDTNVEILHARIAFKDLFKPGDDGVVEMSSRPLEQVFLLGRQALLRCHLFFFRRCGTTTHRHVLVFFVVWWERKKTMRARLYSLTLS